jgi:hypothetical protein
MRNLQVCITRWPVLARRPNDTANDVTHDVPTTLTAGHDATHDDHGIAHDAGNDRPAGGHTRADWLSARLPG